MLCFSSDYFFNYSSLVFCSILPIVVVTRPSNVHFTNHIQKNLKIRLTVSVLNCSNLWLTLLNPMKLQYPWGIPKDVSNTNDCSVFRSWSCFHVFQHAKVELIIDCFPYVGFNIDILGGKKKVSGFFNFLFFLIYFDVYYAWHIQCALILELITCKWIWLITLQLKNELLVRKSADFNKVLTMWYERWIFRAIK